MNETSFAAPVPGGEIVGSWWHRDAPGLPVLGLHGITANHRSFAGLGAALDQPLIAIDQRGRSGSRNLPGPYALIDLADDAARVLDSAGLERVVVAGHSMGAFVATRLAERHPDRVHALVLIDGGLPLRPPPVDVPPEALLGPALERLSMTFESRAAYREFWEQHPALGPYWNDVIEEYLDADLHTIDGELRAGALPEAVGTNLVEFDGRDGYAAALEEQERQGLRRLLLRSPRGLFDETPGLYDDEWLADWTQRLPGLQVRDVADTNHYTILLGSGLPAVVDAVHAVSRP